MGTPLHIAAAGQVRLAHLSQQALQALNVRRLPGEVPATPDAEEARLRAEEELARPAYHPRESLLSRLWRWLLEHLDPREVVPQAPAWLSVLIVVLTLTVLVALLVLLLTRVTGIRRSRVKDRLLFDDERDALTLTRAADAAAERGDWVTAVVERFRAIIRSLDERGAIEDYPGMTAHEAAGMAAPAVGPLDEDLRQGADLFDAVRYGHVVSSPDQDAWMRDLADRIASAPVTDLAGVAR